MCLVVHDTHACLCACARAQAHARAQTRARTRTRAGEYRPDVLAKELTSLNRNPPAASIGTAARDGHTPHARSLSVSRSIQNGINWHVPIVVQVGCGAGVWCGGPLWCRWVVGPGCGVGGHCGAAGCGAGGESAPMSRSAAPACAPAHRPTRAPPTLPTAAPAGHPIHRHARHQPRRPPGARAIHGHGRSWQPAVHGCVTVSGPAACLFIRLSGWLRVCSSSVGVPFTWRWLAACL